MSDVETLVEGAAPAPETQKEQVQETPQEPATATQDTPKEDPPRDEHGRFQKRVNELTRKQYEARREADQYRQRLEKLEAELAQHRQPEPPDPTQDFQGYVRHVASEQTRQALEAEKSRWEQGQEQQRRQAIAQKYATREAEYAAGNPEYQEAVESFMSIAGGNHPELAEILMTAEHGPNVVHYLGTHLDEAAQILALPPHFAAAAVARLEARLSVPKPKPTTNAPAPVPTLGGSAVVSKDPSKMSYAEYKKYRQAG